LIIGESVQGLGNIKDLSKFDETRNKKKKDKEDYSRRI
jgi:hypothetical protein